MSLEGGVSVELVCGEGGAIDNWCESLFSKFIESNSGAMLFTKRLMRLVS